MDVEVPTSRELELEVRFQRVHAGTLETAQRNGELLQRLSELNDELSIRDTTVSELERNLDQIQSETLRLSGLLQQSLLLSQNLPAVPETNNMKAFEREMWELERECRLLSSPSRSPPSVTESSVRPLSPDLRNEIKSTKDELAKLKRQIQSITHSSFPSSPLDHSRQSTSNTTEHHHHHYYYPMPEFSQEPNPDHFAPRLHDHTPLQSKFFHDLPTPPPTASSIASSLWRRNESFRSSLSAWAQSDLSTPTAEVPEPPESVGLERTMSQSSILTTTSNPYFPDSPATPFLKRSSSHESIFEPSPIPIRQLHHSPRSSPLSSSATSSPIYLSASAHLRQNTTSSMLLLSSARGKQSRGLSSRKSFWNLWERPGVPRVPLKDGTSSLGVVVCTEVDVGMLRDALEG